MEGGREERVGGDQHECPSGAGTGEAHRSLSGWCWTNEDTETRSSHCPAGEGNTREHSPASFTTSFQATVGLGLELVGVRGGWSVLYKSLAFLLSWSQQCDQVVTVPTLQRFLKTNVEEASCRLGRARRITLVGGRLQGRSDTSALPGSWRAGVG